MKKIPVIKLSCCFILLLSTYTSPAQEYTIRTFDFSDVLGDRWHFSVDGKDVWLGGEDGAYQLIDGKPKLMYNATNGLFADTLGQVTRDVLGNHWFLSDYGISIKTENSWKYLWRNETGNLLMSTIKRIEDNVWLTLPSEKQIIKYTSAAEDSTVFNTPGEIENIWAAGNGKYWAASSTHLYAFDEEKFTLDTTFSYINDVLVAHDGTLYVADSWYGNDGVRGGIFVKNKNSGKYLKLEIPYADVRYFLDMEESANGALYIASSSGLIIYYAETAQWQRITTAQGLPGNSINDVQIDSNGNLWMTIHIYSWPFQIAAMMYDPSPDFSTVHGKVYDDKNLNGSQDEGEAGLADQFIRLGTSDNYAISSSDGSFALQPFEGANTISWVDNARWDAGVTPVTYQFNAPKDNGTYFEFGLKRNIVTDGSVNVTSSATRRGFDAYYYLSVKNEGTEPFAPEVTMQFDPSLTFIQSTPEATVVDGNQLRWSRPILNGFSEEKIRINFKVSATVPLGDTLKNSVALKVQEKETDQADNVDNSNQVVTGSFDPNDKLVKEGILAERYVKIGDKLTYTIRFQNTGTDTAFVVKIKDELDHSLELTSLQVLSASHAMQYTLQERTITFTFNNIKLPDSTRNEPASHGYVKYEIAPVATIKNETDVRNTADIYFDFNESVRTNTVSNRFVDVLPSDRVTTVEGDEERQVHLYPNPVSDFLMIRGENQTMLKRAEIYTLTGTLIASSEFYNNSTEIDLDNVDAGLYIVKVHGVKTYMKKVLVLPFR